MSLAAAARGADGILVEVHANPELAWSDGPQSLYPEDFRDLMVHLDPVVQAVGRTVA
jgi:3-deoxy-7-phosphoheptulonate synthase